MNAGRKIALANVVAGVMLLACGTLYAQPPASSSGDESGRQKAGS